MVPCGKLAFFPGELIHTNELLVLLGDDYFAERSSLQASEIVDRRLKDVRHKIELCNRQLADLDMRSEVSRDLSQYKQVHLMETEEVASRKSARNNPPPQPQDGTANSSFKYGDLFLRDNSTAATSTTASKKPKKKFYPKTLKKAKESQQLNTDERRQKFLQRIDQLAKEETEKDELATLFHQPDNQELDEDEEEEEDSDDDCLYDPVDDDFFHRHGASELEDPPSQQQETDESEDDDSTTASPAKIQFTHTKTSPRKETKGPNAAVTEVCLLIPRYFNIVYCFSFLCCSSSCLDFLVLLLLVLSLLFP
eukprot:m.164885 g.164885  ORF g.164885 m.164885 type:complete len:309 (-) comp24958_c0_seq8:54-980(-)